MSRLVRVIGKIRKTSGHFTAGFESDNGRIIRTSPILRFLVGKTDAEARNLFRKNSWKAAVVRGPLAEQIAATLSYDEPEEVFQPGGFLEGSTKIEQHRCEVCNEYAGFGYGVSMLKGIEGTWFCKKHLPSEAEEHKYDRRNAAAAA